jgi:hypothetical protein
MSIFKKWFRAVKEERQEDKDDISPDEKTLSNIKKGNVVEFGLTDFDEITFKSLDIRSTIKIILQSKHKYNFNMFNESLMILDHDASNFEIVKKMDVESFLEIVDDNFHGIMDIESDEIVFNDNLREEELISKEKQFSTSGSIESWIVEKDYYAVNDEINCSFIKDGQERECRFFRAKTLNNKSFIMFFVFEGGETEIYASSVIPKNYIKKIY